jgi:hypothetical protein
MIRSAMPSLLEFSGDALLPADAGFGFAGGL